MVVTPNVGNKCIAGINDSIFKITYSTIPQFFYIVDWELLIDELERYDRCQIYKCSNLLTPTYFSNKVFDSKLPCSYSFQSMADLAINQMDIHDHYINVLIIILKLCWCLVNRILSQTSASNQKINIICWILQLISIHYLH